MKASQQYIDYYLRNNSQILAKVQSNSKPGIVYTVYKKDGEWFCDCTAGMFGRKCSHIKQMAEKMGEGDRCWYCGTTRWASGGLDKHHVERRSTSPELVDEESNKMLLCRKCHERATTSHEFEENLKSLWKIKHDKINN